MKKTLSILVTSFVFLTTGCEQKVATVDKTPIPTNDTVQKIQAPTEHVKEIQKEVSKTTQPVVEHTEAKSPASIQNATEQSLAQVSTQSREITKTQESKARSRAQLAEDEMLKNVGK